MEGPVVQELTGGRLHLSHGPIDVVLRAWGPPRTVRAAHHAAGRRFATILGELVEELPALRRPIAEGPRVCGAVARRMVAAVRPFREEFVTPMAAVAGAVADELLAAMLAASPDLDKAFVNDGGDVAVHVALGETLILGIALGDVAYPSLDGSILLRSGDGVGGVATSGRQGRSFSLGIADAVTVLAADAAAADAAATLIANAVDLDGPVVERRPARSLDPDSDLGDRLVTTGVGPLSPAEVAAALDQGCALARAYLHRRLIRGAALSLGGETRIVGASVPRLHATLEPAA